MFSFYKIQVAGNDFIIINYIEKRLDFSFKLLSQFLCDRHFSIGADNLLIIDLTQTFGEGNEPSKEWCDEHIKWFDGTTTIYK